MYNDTVAAASVVAAVETPAVASNVDETVVESAAPVPVAVPGVTPVNPEMTATPVLSYAFCAVAPVVVKITCVLCWMIAFGVNDTFTATPCELAAMALPLAAQFSVV